MEILRSIVSRIGRHPLVSILGVFFFIGLLIAARTISERNNGLLTEPLKKSSVMDSVYGIGTVTASRSYSIKPGVTQTLKNLYVKEGDLVKKGDRLANIDLIDYRAQFDGVVNYLPFKVGENVFAATPTLVVTDLSDRYVVVTLVQQGAMRIKPGQKAVLSFDSYREKKYDGVVKSVYSYNGSFLARIDVDNLPAEILPDMTADVAIIIQNLENVLVIPTVAYDSGHVWVKRSTGIPTAVPVKLGVIDDLNAQVVEGDIHEGDQLIIRKKVGQ